jgi:CheY-like chemotaxis protein
LNSRRISAATVLVVDDQDILRLLMCKTLESGGFRVLAASNGEDALTLYRRARPPIDLLVTDYRMPGMTGVELACECTSLNRNLSVLYVSGSMPGEDLLADLAMEKRGFLAKPFRQAKLLCSAKAVLAMEPVAASSREIHWPSLGRLSMGR